MKKPSSPDSPASGEIAQRRKAAACEADESNLPPATLDESALQNFARNLLDFEMVRLLEPQSSSVPANPTFGKLESFGAMLKLRHSDLNGDGPSEAGGEVIAMPSPT